MPIKLSLDIALGVCFSVWTGGSGKEARSVYDFTGSVSGTRALPWIDEGLFKKLYGK